MVTYGMMLHYTLQAAAQVSEQDGIEAEVVDLRTLRPLDTEMILESVRKTSKALIVQEDTPVVSVASEVAAVIADKAFFELDGPVRRSPRRTFPPCHTARFRRRSSCLRQQHSARHPAAGRNLKWTTRSNCPTLASRSSRQ